MRVGIIAPEWGNSWLPIYERLIRDSGNEAFHFTPDSALTVSLDVCLHMWARDNNFIREAPVNIMFMRRYEAFDVDHWVMLPWERIDHLIFCNQWIKDMVDGIFQKNEVEQQTHLIYNAVDRQQWTYRDRSHGRKIGMACHIHPKKNIPLALQVLQNLPFGYELHIAGAVQDTCLAHYIMRVSEAVGRKVVMHGHISREKLDEWWEDKNYCLSTSISEGNPNNILEAMAKGIKPVVHAWPGADTQFPVFYSAMEAAADILRGPYDSSLYLDIVDRNYNVDNYRKVLNLIQEGGETHGIKQKTARERA